MSEKAEAARSRQYVECDGGWALVNSYPEGVALTAYGWQDAMPAVIRRMTPGEAVQLSRALFKAAAEALGVGV